jgi:hypothetical protein
VRRVCCHRTLALGCCCDRRPFRPGTGTTGSPRPMRCFDHGINRVSSTGVCGLGARSPPSSTQQQANLTTTRRRVGDACSSTADCVGGLLGDADDGACVCESEFIDSCVSGGYVSGVGGDGEYEQDNDYCSEECVLLLRRYETYQLRDPGVVSTILTYLLPRPNTGCEGGGEGSGLTSAWPRGYNITHERLIGGVHCRRWRRSWRMSAPPRRGSSSPSLRWVRVLLSLRRLLCGGALCALLSGATQLTDTWCGSCSRVHPRGDLLLLLQGQQTQRGPFGVQVRRTACARSRVRGGSGRPLRVRQRKSTCVLL